MTREEVIALAREVGFVAYGEDAGEYRIPTPAFHGRLERFAELVAAAEREACADIVKRNADACVSDSMLHGVLMSNAVAILERGSNDAA